jgi:hypothetical protein
MSQGGPCCVIPNYRERQRNDAYDADDGETLIDSRAKTAWMREPASFIRMRSRQGARRVDHPEDAGICPTLKRHRVVPRAVAGEA